MSLYLSARNKTLKVYLRKTIFACLKLECLWHFSKVQVMRISQELWTDFSCLTCNMERSFMKWLIVDAVNVEAVLNREQFLIYLVRINGLIDVAERRVRRVFSINASGSWFAALVNSIVLDVARCVIASEESSFVVVGVTRESASNVRCPIVSHLSEVTDVMTRLVGK